MHVFQDRCIKDIHRGLRVFMLVLDLRYFQLSSDLILSHHLIFIKMHMHVKRKLYIIFLTINSVVEII